MHHQGSVCTEAEDALHTQHTTHLQQKRKKGQNKETKDTQDSEQGCYSSNDNYTSKAAPTTAL